LHDNSFFPPTNHILSILLRGFCFLYVVDCMFTLPSGTRHIRRVVIPFSPRSPSLAKPASLFFAATLSRTAQCSWHYGAAPPLFTLPGLTPRMAPPPTLMSVRLVPHFLCIDRLTLIGPLNSRASLNRLSISFDYCSYASAERSFFSPLSARVQAPRPVHTSFFFFVQSVSIWLSRYFHRFCVDLHTKPEKLKANRHTSLYLVPFLVLV